MLELLSIEQLAKIEFEQLRQAVRAGRSELQRRRNTSKCSFSPEEWQTIEQGARKLKQTALGLAEQIARLRDAPEQVTLRDRAGNAYPMTRIMLARFSHRWREISAAVLLGDGRLCLDQDAILGQQDGRPAPGEYWHPFRLFGEAFIQAWARLPTPPTPTAAKLCLDRAGRQDTPQEAILDWCIEAVKAWFQERADAPVDWILGRRSYADVPLGNLLRTERKTRTNRWDEPRWTEPLVRAIELYLTQVNLIAPESLDLAPDLAIPLGDVWAWGVKQERLAAVNARRLRDAVIQEYGFRPIKFKDDPAWIKQAATGEDGKDSGLSPEELHKGKAKTGSSVIITATGRVYINGIYRCVVEGKAAHLPKEDQIVRRMLTVATTHRNRISTFTEEDRQVLSELFTDARHTRVFELVSKGGDKHET